jgi:hypothetical protein
MFVDRGNQGRINPHFSPAFYCGSGSGHVYRALRSFGLLEILSSSLRGPPELTYLHLARSAKPGVYTFARLIDTIPQIIRRSIKISIDIPTYIMACSY